jgi:DedD protein
MTNRDAPHDFDPKHRIIGAVVVVALVVILVPLILSERETPPQAVTPPSASPSAIGEEENKVAITKVPPPAAPSEPPKAAAAAPSEAPKAGSAPAAPATQERPKPASDSKITTPVTKASGSNEARPSAPASGWMVQVGTFSNTANATRLEQKLRAEGQPVRSERIQLDNGKAVRLRVGPFRDRAAAVKAQERILKDVGVKGVVLAYP